MLTVILNILKILGIILLVILGVLLVAILLVLFFPISYRIEANRQHNLQDSESDGATTEDRPEFINRADIKAWWLFGLLRARFRYPEPGKLKVKLLFFTLFESKQAENTDDEEQSDDVTEVEVTSDLKKSDVNNTDKPTKTVVSKQEQTQKNVDDPPKPGPIEKIQYTFSNFCDKIKEIRENIEYYKEVLLCDDIKELLKYAFMRLGKILKSIRPRKMQADIRFGTGSPDTTGYVFGLYGMVCPHLGKNVFVTPDFEQTILIGEFYAKGHITLFKVLWNGLMIIKDRRLWELKDKLTRNK